MPPSPVTTALWPASQASCRARQAASRPTRRGGSSTLAGQAAARRRRVGRGGGVDRRQQRQRLGRRLGADLVLQQLLAAVEGEQRRRAVALQVEQADDAPVRGFGQSLALQKLARVRQRGGVVAGALGRIGAGFERGLRAQAAALALQRQPGDELRAELVAGIAEHLLRVAEVVRQAVGERQRRVAADELDAELAPELEQALAQRVAGDVGRAARPEQDGETGARRRPFEREPGQQGRVAQRQVGLPRIRMHESRGGGEAKLHGGERSRAC